MIRTTDKSVYTQGETIAAKKVSDLRQRVKIVNETEDAILISIHQNTFSESRYSGAQVFYGPEGESSILAEMVQGAFCKSLNPGSNRRAKKADGIYLMQHIDCTGILVECGFLSNKEEEAALHSPDYQRKICCVIATTVGTFLTK
jgi:N-acetylmuramoyl-L-alanine amidase